MLGSTIFSLIWTVGLAAAANDRLPGMAWLATMAVLCWLAVFIVALPGAGIVFSLLWPITRRRTAAAWWVCIIAGATMGIILAPLASPKLHSATWTQLCVFALAGAALAAFYLILANRLGRDARSAVTPSVPRA